MQTNTIFNICWNDNKKKKKINTHNQSMSQNIGSINAWTCCNAYA